MAKVPTPSAINKSEHGLGRQLSSAKGPFGGGTKYHKMDVDQSFKIEEVKGHQQKKPNLTPVDKK
jgi:hypothetical protein